MLRIPGVERPFHRAADCEINTKGMRVGNSLTTPWSFLSRGCIPGGLSGCVLGPGGPDKHSLLVGHRTLGRGWPAKTKREEVNWGCVGSRNFQRGIAGWGQSLDRGHSRVTVKSWPCFLSCDNFHPHHHGHYHHIFHFWWHFSWVRQCVKHFPEPFDNSVRV